MNQFEVLKEYYEKANKTRLTTEGFLKVLANPDETACDPYKLNLISKEEFFRDIVGSLDGETNYSDEDIEVITKYILDHCLGFPIYHFAHIVFLQELVGDLAYQLLEKDNIQMEDPKNEIKDLITRLNKLLKSINI